VKDFLTGALHPPLSLPGINFGEIMLIRKKLTALTLLAFASSVTLPAFAEQPPTASGSASSQSQTQSQAAGGALLFAPDTVNNSTVRYATNSAFAPALTSSNDTCMGSSSLGATGMSFGVSLGSTWTDSNCKLLKNARELWNQGNHAASMALLCTDDDVKYSISVSGGVMDRRMDGAVIRLGCPMSKEEWISKGRPLIDPMTGQQVVAGSVIQSAPVVVGLGAPASMSLASVDTHGIVTTTTIVPKSAADIEAHAAIVRANMEMAAHSVVNK
jgi:hypothetical protein